MSDSPPSLHSPLLRSPPFDWLPADTAAISLHAPMARDGACDDPKALGRMIDAIRDARVGGSFWGARAARRHALVVKPESLGSDAWVEAVLAAPGDALVVVATPLPPEIGDRLARAGATMMVEPVDPWSVLDAGVTLLAGTRDEWALLAAIAGAEVTGQDGARLHAALATTILRDATYRDCFTGQACDIEQAIAILAEWRRAADRAHPVVAATGISWWKRDAIARFLWLGRARQPALAEGAAEAIAAARRGHGAVAVWPSRAPADLADQAAAAGVALVAVEDGFIRSIGLGAGLHPPSSIVLDGRGIYYDPSRPSDLEHILEHTELSPDLVARAARLRTAIVAYGISKYASGGDAASSRRASPRRDRRTILVPGQVEDDQSVLTGGGGVAGNLDLLRRARALEPDAHILFKPHPDVDAGHRAGRVPDSALLDHADEIVRGGSMAALLGEVDAVHVLTSLTGFEALLRGVQVTTHGAPFYAGWGLTRDLGAPLPRRTRRLALDELVAGALLLYPLYLDPETQLPCPAEILLERFRNQRKPQGTWLTRLRALQGKFAKLVGTTTD